MVQKQEYRKWQLTQKERVEIYSYLKQGLSYRKIWQELNRSHTTISREIKRNSIDKWWWVFEYCALEAEKNRLERRDKANKSHIILRRDWKQREKLIDLLKKKWDSWWPDEILWRIKQELWIDVISTSTFYRFIREYMPSLQGYLRYKSFGYKTRWKQDWRWKLFEEIPLITERPDSMNNREKIGSREFDTVVSNKKVKWGLATAVERKARYIRMRKVDNLESETLYWTMRYMMRNETITSWTIDNGSEFAKFLALAEVLNFKPYRCHPYASYEKGTNEKHNWFIRRYIPKWVDISQYSDEEIQEIEDKLNHKPRKILGYKTPYEVYHNTQLNYLK